MTDTSRLVSEASAQIGRMGSAFYFTEPAISKGAELGLGTFRFYVLGRGGVLGDVDAAEVQSAFGYFAEGIIRTQWDKARTILDPRTAALEYMACCAEFGRTKFSSLEGLEPLCAALDAVNDAADPAGLALYAGIRAEPLAGDPPARAMQLVTVLREYRGSAHLVAIVAQLLDPKIAHFIARPEMWNGFGYSDDEKPEVTDEHRRKLAAANGLT
ncbi:MAG TPA: hypothetical protein VEJ44_00705, partial [Acidimicrobiales bacterium]|nr:hypothetical protein [Acidimicrobiales bacterium]